MQGQALNVLTETNCENPKTMGCPGKRMARGSIERADLLCFGLGQNAF